MANTVVEFDVPEGFNPVLARAAKLAPSQANPNPAGYVITADPSLPMRWTITVPEALVEFYRFTLEDGDGLTFAVGYAEMVDTVGPIPVAAELLVTKQAFTIWGALLSAHTIVGSFGKAIADILAKVNLIGTGQATVSAPVSENGMITAPIIIGDDYLVDLGNPFKWTVDKLPNADPTQCTTKFGGENDNNNTWNVSGETIVVNPSDSTKWDLTFELPAAITSPLPVGSYDWSVEITDNNTKKVTRVKNSTFDNRATLQKKQT